MNIYPNMCRAGVSDATPVTGTIENLANISEYQLLQFEKRAFQPVVGVHNIFAQNDKLLVQIYL